jgi:hypothetical protein
VASGSERKWLPMKKGRYKEEVASSERSFPMFCVDSTMEV